MVSELGQAGAIESYKGRGVYVPRGLKASWIMEGAWVLEREYEIPPYISRMMVAAVLEAIDKAKAIEIADMNSGAYEDSTASL